MAGVTGDLRVFSRQRPVPVALMVEGRRLPALVGMTTLAVVGESARVRVLAAMTTEALAWQWVLKAAAAMAIAARDAGVRPFEGKAGCLCMVELGRTPLARGMALPALHTALAVVHVVRSMAGDALLRRLFVALAEVALCAGKLGMAASECEDGLAVVELHLRP